MFFVVGKLTFTLKVRGAPTKVNHSLVRGVLKTMVASSLKALLALTLLTSCNPSPIRLGVPKAPAGPEAEVCFSPKGGCAMKIVDAIQQAKKSIYLQAYGFTSDPIAQALASAKGRGVEVYILLDRSDDAGSSHSRLKTLLDSHVPTWIDGKHAIAHNKVVVIDEELVLTGSYNFTAAAERSNAENMLFIHSTPLASKYITNWKTHQAHSVAPTAPKVPLTSEE